MATRRAQRDRRRRRDEAEVVEGRLPGVIGGSSRAGTAGGPVYRSAPVLACGCDVEVHAEEVRRVVLRFQRGEPVVVDSVARPYELFLFLA